MKIMVTGGAGFIGSNFIYYMLDKHPEYDIVCVDLLTYAGNLETLEEARKSPRFKFIRADIADRGAMEMAFQYEKPDVVVNFAAESHVDRSITDPGIFIRTNVMGTQVLLDCARQYGVSRYHQVSTDEVYGDLPLERKDLFFTEETPIHTSSLFVVKGGGGLACAGILQDIRNARHGFAVFQQLRTVPLSGEADSAYDLPRTGG